MGLNTTKAAERPVIIRTGTMRIKSKTEGNMDQYNNNNNK
jgi:hypothetical protein